jgi:ubiquinol-cytochrome c reductase cytochrome b subunit
MSRGRDVSLPPILSWVQRWTRLTALTDAADKPATLTQAWLRTTAGVVTLLVCLQLITGLLLAFYYVPSSESAHTTVSYVEKVVQAGAWIRALHHYGSQWLTLALVLHLAQMIWFRSYLRRPVGWIASVALLGIMLAEGATGYSLPWDVRAFFATRVTESMVGGIPIVGQNLRQWILGGSQISPATLMRFFAFHAIFLPAFVLAVVVSRYFIFREPSQTGDDSTAGNSWRMIQFTRNTISAGAVFLALAVYALFHHAPLGPPADTADMGYLPRPGPQFLWLFELLRLLPGNLASVLGTALPAAVLLALASLPFTAESINRRFRSGSAPRLIASLFFLVVLMVAALTAAAYIQDARDPLLREELARQAQEEREYLLQPFTPLRLDSTGEANTAAVAPSPTTPSLTQINLPANGDPPQSYISNCAQCHGFNGEGTALFPRLTGVSSKPRRTPEDLVNLLDDPRAYGLKPPMNSFANKLSPMEKLEIAQWLGTLKKRGRGKR